MKPTKEQLTDPKWWNEKAGPHDKYCYRGVISGACFFSRDFDDTVAGCELLAKRPKAEWMPEVGEWFLSRGREKMAFIGVHSGNGYVCETEDGGLIRLLGFVGCKPIKTQREELIDILISTGNLSEGMQADAILAMFELTEKDGE